MPVASIKKVGILILVEHDLNAARSFYEQLGLKKQFELEGRWIEFLIGDVKLGLCKTSQEPIDRQTGIVLEVDDIKLMYENLKDSISFVRVPIEATHGIMATIKDPGGNLIDLYHPTPQKLHEMMQKTK